MKDVELRSRLIALGMPADKATRVAVHIRDKIHPVAAVAASNLHLKAGRLNGMAGTQTAVEGGTLGAKAGSAILPGVGTVIGAALGAIAGAMIKTGQKPQRLAAAKAAIAQLRTIPADYVGRTISDQDFLSLFYGLFLATGFMPSGAVLTDHPSAMTGWAQPIIDNMRACVRAAANLPPGAQVTVTLKPGFKAPQPKPFTFVNPGLGAAPAVWAQTVFDPMLDGMLFYLDAHYRQVSESNADAVHVMSLFADKAINEVAPQSLSSTIANAPVANVPASLVSAGQNIAQQIAQRGIMPQLTTPVVNVPMTLPNPSSVPLVSSVPTVSPVFQAPAPIGAALSPVQDTTAGIMQNMLAQQGMNFTSPAAQQTLADVAANGVTSTPTMPNEAGLGPTNIPPKWALPALGIAAGLFGFAIIMKPKH